MGGYEGGEGRGDGHAGHFGVHRAAGHGGVSGGSAAPGARALMKCSGWVTEELCAQRSGWGLESRWTLRGGGIMFSGSV